MSSLLAAVPQWRARVWATLTLFALLVMETITAALWYQAVFTPRGPAFGVVFTIIFAIFALSCLIPRGLELLRWHRAVKQALFAGWISLAGFASLKLLVYPQIELSLIELVRQPLLFILQSNTSGISFFHLIAMLLLVWRGVVLARSPLTLSVVQASFQLGLFSLLLYGMFFAPTHPQAAAGGLYFYLFCGLTAMSLSRIANLSENRGGRVPRFGLGWFASIVLAGMTIVGLAVLAGWASSGQFADWFVRVFIIILGLLTALVLFLLSPLLLWMARLIPLLADWINQLLERLRNIPALEQAAKFLEQIGEGLAALAPLLTAGRGLVLAGILLALFAFVLIALYLRRIQLRLLEEAPSEQAQQVNDPLSLQKLLQRMMKNARGLRLRRPAQLLAAARIRQIYRQLMLLSQKMGARRPPSITPLEFLPRLSDLFPEEQAGLERITAAYVNVRYGSYPETSAEVDEIQAAWERVRRQGRRMLTLRQRKN